MHTARHPAGPRSAVAARLAAASPPLAASLVTPLGRLYLMATAEGLCRAAFQPGPRAGEALVASLMSFVSPLPSDPSVPCATDSRARMAVPEIHAATDFEQFAPRVMPDATAAGSRAENGPEGAIAAEVGMSRQPAAGGDAAAAEVIGHAMSQVEAWFAGRRDRLEMPLAAVGSRWQQAVWAATRALVPGERVTYGDLARRLGRPKAARAVGAALGANPCLLFTPCHRVVGIGGRMTGYAGGIGRKRWLLAFEAGEPLPPPG